MREEAAAAVEPRSSGEGGGSWESLGSETYQRYPAASKSGVLCRSSDVTLLMVNCVTRALSFL